MIMTTDQIGRPIIVHGQKAKEILFAVSERRTYTKINPNSGYERGKRILTTLMESTEPRYR